MASAYRDHRMHPLLSRPLKVRWLGWETTTAQLQQAGWELWAEELVVTSQLRLMMVHGKTRVQAMTDMVEFDFHRAQVTGEWSYLESVVIPCQALCQEVKVIYDRSATHMGELPMAFRPIDATPQVRLNSEVHRIEDLFHFADAHRSLILPEAEVPDLLAAIIERQEPKRQERLWADLRDEKHRKGFQAKIITAA